MALAPSSRHETLNCSSYFELYDVAEPNFQNRTLYHGDNLDFLRGMNSETVHLIATDPPFNKNRDFHATPDSLAAGARFKDRWRWDDDVQEEWWEAIKDDWRGVYEVVDAARASYGDDMAAFLCWLGVRLMEMRRVLRQDGSIYLHCDHTAHAYTKCLMDGIFGSANFRNEIAWCYTGPSNTKRWFPRKHDTILFYTKSRNQTFNREEIRIPYHHETIARRGRIEGKRSIISASVKTADRRSATEVESEFGGGKVPEDWWSDIPILTNQRERTGYPTQKPLALYERIIRASSNVGDIVLDPFCGCATTPIAAERLKRQWVGMDIWDGAYTQVMERMERDTVLRFDDKNHVTLPQVHYDTEPPRRTDDNELAAPGLKLKIRRAMEAWEKLSHRQMVKILEYAQRSNGNVICAGCGRELEREFMELDHITPRVDGGENHIRNRILLCRPCNGRKGQYLTLRGLLRENKKANWMKDEGLAQLVRETARERAEWVRDYFDSEECQSMIRGSQHSGWE